MCSKSFMHSALFLVEATVKTFFFSGGTVDFCNECTPSSG